MRNVFAYDLGASNGRLMVSQFDGETIRLKEIHRFPNHPEKKGNHLHWNLDALFSEMKKGIVKACKQEGILADSIGFDTWGVDFGLLNSAGQLLEAPYSYRDTYSLKAMEIVHKEVNARELFKRTGVESASINTINQLYAIKLDHSDILDKAETLLMMPNLINYLFSGQKSNEFTISTTTQFLNWETQAWDEELIGCLNLPAGIFAPIIQPNTILGETLPSINKELAVQPINVVAVSGHDTACALASLPIQSKDTAFVSCGTWSLIGVQVPTPIVSNDAFEWGFTNEGTADAQYRLQKNNMGLWLIQNCLKKWNQDSEVISYETINQLVKQTKPFQSFIDPDHFMFFNPEDMPAQIQYYCEQSGQKIPETKGEIIRCALESLAFKYRWIIERLEQLTDAPISTIRMGGGGIQNYLLCQFTANATNRLVMAGPVEASAIGNSLSQLMAFGDIHSIDEARLLVERSFHIKEYEPENAGEWQEAYARFLTVIGTNIFTK